MGVETGPSGAVAVAGPSPSFEAAPAVGSIKAFGPKYESLSFAPIDSPVGKRDLQNMVPYKVGMISPTGSISFSPVKDEKASSHLRGEAELSVAESIPVTGQAEPISGSEILREANHWLGINEPASGGKDPLITPDLGAESLSTKTALIEAGMLDLGKAVGGHPGTEVRIVTRQVGLTAGARAAPESAGTNQAEAISAPVVADQLVEDIVEERKLTTDPIDGQSIRTDEDEEIFKRKKSYLVDQPVLAQVLVETAQAVAKGEKEAERLGLGKRIFGVLIAKFLPAQHEGNTGGAVKPFEVDGTIPARKEVIKATKEFASKKEVKAVVLGNRPVTIGEEGERASKNEVKTTFRDFIVKPTKLVEIAEKRIVKKRREVSSGSTPVFGFRDQNIKPNNESSLEDYPDLAEVFGRAAM